MNKITKSDFFFYTENARRAEITHFITRIQKKRITEYAAQNASPQSKTNQQNKRKQDGRTKQNTAGYKHDLRLPEALKNTKKETTTFFHDFKEKY